MHNINRTLVKRGWLWFRWRGTLLVVAFIMGLIAFVLGVGVSDRSGLPQADLITQVYYTLGLFVLGGLDLGVPVGGPLYGRVMLWAAYFLAPAITTSAVIEGLIRAVRPEMWRMRRMKNHVVIVGSGRLGALCLERLEEANPGCAVLLVDRQRERLQREAHRPGVEVLGGDIASEKILHLLRLDMAARVFLLTGDDFSNLDAAARIAQRHPHLARDTVVHVSDLSMVRVMDRLQLLGDSATFNSHRIAATHLVRTRLTAHFARTEPRDVVILVGFGRFGQTVLDELQRCADGCFALVIIIDLDAERAAMSFAQDVGFGESFQHTSWNGDMQDPIVWQRLSDALADVKEPVFVLGTGDDRTNVTAALKLADHFPDAYVVARQFARSPFVDHVAEAHGFDIVTVSELLLGSMPEAWFSQ